MLENRFVCVALDARKERYEYKDADGDFVRATNCVTVTASGSICVVTANGKALTGYQGPQEKMEKYLNGALKIWEGLPESERKPVADILTASHTPDLKRVARALPARALVMRVFNRQLGWDKDGGLRYAIMDDYLPRTSKSQADRYAEAHNDFMWIPESEWQGLIPPDPVEGNRWDAPVSFALRLFRFHLDPCRGFSEGAAFTRSKADAGRLTLVAQKVTLQSLTLRIEGSADLKETGRDEPSVFQPSILGFLEYDRAAKRITRFDMLALGTASGLPRDANGVITPRRGPYPLGIAFELVASPTPAEKLCPRGARDNPAAYLAPR